MVNCRRSHAHFDSSPFWLTRAGRPDTMERLDAPAAYSHSLFRRVGSPFLAPRQGGHFLGGKTQAILSVRSSSATPLQDVDQENLLNGFHFSCGKLGAHPGFIVSRSPDQASER